MRFHSLLLMTALLAAISSLAGCGPAHVDAHAAVGGARSDALVRVTPLKPTRKTLIRYTEQPGQIAAFEETPIYAKASGYVRRVYVDIGDEVTGPVYEENELREPGQLLLEIDVPELEREVAQKVAAASQAESEIRQAEAALRVANAVRNSAQAAVEEAEATVERVEADYDRWKSELARITDLAARQSVTDRLVDETQSKFKAAEAARKEVSARIRSAEARLAESEALISKAEADIDAAHAMLGVAHADRDRVQALLGFAEIRAPFSGVVAARRVDPGHLVTAGATGGEPLLVVVQSETVRIFVDVPEIDALHIQNGAEAIIRMPSLPTGSVEGTVTRTTWVLNQATRTLRTEVDVPNPEGRLRPGMYAHARIKVAERPAALILPKSALMVSGGETSVWRIETDGTLRRTVVETGLESGGEFEIVSELSGDEKLIGVNVNAFREGQRVEIVEPVSSNGNKRS
jgi:HlyD family secretion protein